MVIESGEETVRCVNCVNRMSCKPMDQHCRILLYHGIFIKVFCTHKQKKNMESKYEALSYEHSNYKTT
jgi:hypothetical protein